MGKGPAGGARVGPTGTGKPYTGGAGGGKRYGSSGKSYGSGGKSYGTGGAAGAAGPGPHRGKPYGTGAGATGANVGRPYSAGGMGGPGAPRGMSGGRGGKPFAGPTGGRPMGGRGKPYLAGPTVPRGMTPRGLGPAALRGEAGDQRPTSRRIPEGPGPGGPGPGGGGSTHWGSVADWYDQLVGDWGSEYHREVVIPGTLRLLSPGPGEKVIDVACGQGVFCRVLANRKVRVTGVDAAGELIRLAQERNEGTEQNTQFVVADARNLLIHEELEPGGFDAAVCLLAIQNIDPILPVFEGMAKLLKDNGRVVLVMMHPCFRGPKMTSWEWDAELMVQYRRVEGYLLPRRDAIITHPGKNSSAHTWSFHRPLQTYVRALRQAGFAVDAIEEWPSHKTSDSGPRAAAENMARKEIPLFLALRAVKLR